MQLSPEQKHRIIQEAARLIVDEIKEDSSCDLTELYIIPITIAARMLGIQARTLEALLPVVKITERNRGIKMSDLAEFVETRTVYPQSKKRKSA
jgi:hypothetical protein